MKKTLIAFAFVIAAPALAASHQHRHELAQSGCTQVQEANGECGANNARGALQHTDREAVEIKEFLLYSVHSQKTDAAYDALQGYGFNNPTPGVWRKGDWKLTLHARNDRIISNELTRD